MEKGKNAKRKKRIFLEKHKNYLAKKKKYHN